MKHWTEIVENKLQKQKKSVAKINLDKVTVSYSEKVKQNRVLKSLTGDEEVVRAFLIDKLVNELDYKPENLEIEKEYEEFNNLMQQMINFIFVELWKNYAGD